MKTSPDDSSDDSLSEWSQVEKRLETSLFYENLWAKIESTFTMASENREKEAERAKMENIATMVSENREKGAEMARCIADLLQTNQNLTKTNACINEFIINKASHAEEIKALEDSLEKVTKERDSFQTSVAIWEKRWNLEERAKQLELKWKTASKERDDLQRAVSVLEKSLEVAEKKRDKLLRNATVDLEGECTALKEILKNVSEERDDLRRTVSTMEDSLKIAEKRQEDLLKLLEDSVQQAPDKQETSKIGIDLNSSESDLAELLSAAEVSAKSIWKQLQQGRQLDSSSKGPPSTSTAAATLPKKQAN